MILGLEVALLVLGLILLAGGKVPLTSTTAINGLAVRLVGVIGLLPVPLALLTGIVTGVIRGFQGRAFDQAHRMSLGMIEVGITLGCLALMLVLLAILGSWQQAARSQQPQWSDRYADRKGGSRRRIGDEEDEDEVGAVGLDDHAPKMMTPLLLLGGGGFVLLVIGCGLGGVGTYLLTKDQPGANEPIAQNPPPVEPVPLVIGADGGPPNPPPVPAPNAEPKFDPPELKPAPGMKVVELIALIDPVRDRVHGDGWELRDKVLHCRTGNFVPRMEIPYLPPEEYDFIVVFSQPGLRNGINLILPNPTGGSFYWNIGSNSGSRHSFSSVPQRNGDQAGLIQVNRLYTTTIQVRRGGVKCFLDGKELINHPTNFRDLTCDNWRTIRDTRLLAIGCDDPAVFHSVRLVEITGAGRGTR
jgi:hypothetical protein